MGVGKAWGKSIDIWSWSSLLVAGRSELVIFLIFCVHAALRSITEGRVTLDVVYRKMAWSFNALYEGMWPVFDWDNNRIRDEQAKCTL